METGATDNEIAELHRSGEPGSARVTVCVSLYQYAELVTSCLDSVRAQTLEAVGLSVVDDASTDGGGEGVLRWLEAHGSRFAEALLLRHERNAGLAAARNTAISRARSPLVFVLDADNQLYPRCLEVLSAALEDERFAFAYSILEQFGTAVNLVGCDAWSPRQLARGNTVDAMALLRRSTWERIGGYRSMRTGGWEDYDFWCRCIEAGLAGVLVPEILCRYRVHGRSMLRSSTDTLRSHLRVCAEMRAAHPWLEL